MASLAPFRSIPQARLAGITLALAALLLVAATGFAEPVAVIAAVKGKVEVTPARGGAAQAAVFGRALERGDRIAVAAGGGATLFYNDGKVMEVPEHGKFMVGDKPLAKPGVAPAAGLPGEVYASVTKFVAGGSRETGLMPVAELRSAPALPDTPFLVAPRKTALLTDRPAFTWRSVPGATRYHVTLSSAEAGELWSRDVETATLPFPPDAPALAAGGDFLWEVEARTDLKSLRRESSEFNLLAAQQAAAVRGNLTRIRDSVGGPDGPAAEFLTGSYLSGLGLYLDASEHFGALCKLSPASPAPHEALGAVYTRVGLMDLAAAEYKQALALTREP